jgi:hypothetical protein
MHHVRAASLPGMGVLCASGVRAWFAHYDLDYRAFLHHGLPLETLEATGDAFALRACAIARAGVIDGR